MSISSTQFVILGVGAFFLSGYLTSPIRIFAIKFGVMDLPNMKRKTQKEPIPYLGGVAIALSVVSVTYMAILSSDNTEITFSLVTYTLIPALILGLMGLVDDIKSLPALPRLVVQTLVAIVVAILMLRHDLIGTPIGNQFLDTIVNVVWIVVVCNSINFFDNLDGGAAGIVAVSTLGICIIAAQQGQELVTALSVVTCGATIGFLMWNKSPAKIYMGDAGALFLGFLVATLTLRLDPGISPRINSIAILPVLIAVPILDTCIAVFSRIQRGISPFTGGKDHLSHRLARKGFSRRNSAYSLWGIQASFVAIALIIYLFDRNIGTTGVFVALIYWLGLFIWFWRIDSED